MEPTQDGPLWAVMLQCIGYFFSTYLTGRYIYAPLPMVLRVVILLVGAILNAFYLSEVGSRLLFIAISAPILLAFRQALVSSGGLMLLSSIMGLCYFLVPGSAGLPGREHDSVQRFGPYGYLILLYFAFGVLIPQTELTWSFAKAKMKEPLVRWLLFSAFMLAVASACFQFLVIVRKFVQEVYLAVVNIAFVLYRKWLTWYYYRRFPIVCKSSGPFKYNRLNQAASEIRLLNLAPTCQGTHIQGELVISTIASLPAFEAISYRWKMGPRVPILLNGQEFLVFQAVYFMLQSLRHTNEYRVLWIDAICINQIDIAEKEWQILIMGDIFGSAAKVVGWLDYDPVSLGGLSFLAAVGSWASELERLGVSRDDAELFEAIPIPPKVKTILQQPHHLVWASIASVLSNDWFSRVWVIQEVAKGSEVILRHANEEISWQALYSAILALSSFYFSGSDVYMPSSGKDHSYIGINTANIISISRLREKLNQDPRGLSLGLLLRETQFFKATIPRDMVYGLLGLSTDMARKKIMVDYSMCEDVLFQDVSRYILLKEQSLDYLLTAGTGFLWPEGNRPDPRLSSWVPPRRHAFGAPSSVSNTALHLFHTATHLSPAVEAVIGEKGLVAVQGINFDQITLISPIFFDPEHLSQSSEMTGIEKTKSLVSNMDMAFDFARHNTGAHLYSGDISDTLWALITIKVDESDPNQVPEKENIVELTKTAFIAVREGSRIWGRSTLATWSAARKAGKTSTVEDALRFKQHERTLISLITPTFDKRLCWTSKGYLGIVPPHSEVGDTICIFAGGNLPCVVRPRPQCGENAQHHSYELLGACYIQGIAHRELCQVDLAMEPIILG